MPPNIIEHTVDIGVDAFGRRVTATRHQHDGKWMWRIDSLPVSNRDEGERMDALTDENLKCLRQAEELVRTGTWR